MNRQELLSRLDDGTAALNELASRPIHSDHQIRIGSRFYAPEDIESLADALAELSFHVGCEPETR
jgi:hypothetical protein